MEKYINFIKRHIVWILVGIATLSLLVPSFAEVRTMLLLITMECLAIVLSGLAQFIYTKIDFTGEHPSNGYSPLNLGMIFLGVHILSGLTILGVYLAQFI